MKRTALAIIIILGSTGCVSNGLINAIPKIPAARGYNGKTVGDTSGSESHQTGNTINLTVSGCALTPGAFTGLFTIRQGADNASQKNEGGGIQWGEAASKPSLSEKLFGKKKTEPAPSE